MINIGNVDLSSLHVTDGAGTVTDIGEVFVGSDKVWPEGSLLFNTPQVYTNSELEALGYPSNSGLIRFVPSAFPYFQVSQYASDDQDMKLYWDQVKYDTPRNSITIKNAAGEIVFSALTGDATFDDGSARFYKLWVSNYTNPIEFIVGEPYTVIITDY